MNKLLIIIASLFFTINNAWADNIFEVEAKILKEADEFKDHPLHEFLVPEGQFALGIALPFIDSTCRAEINFKTPLCEKEFNLTLQDLKTKGYKNIAIEHLTNERFYQLINKLQKFYRFKHQYIQNMMFKAPRGTAKRKKLGNMIADMEKKSHDFLAKIDKTK